MNTLAELTDLTFDAVLFDLDGTLINSLPVVERSWITLMGEYGVDPRRLAGFHGIPAAAVLEQLLPAGQRADALARIIDLETSDTEGITILPGAAQALSALPAGRAAIVTSCTSDLAAVRLAATGLPAPPVLVTADQTPVGKPAPDPYLLAATLLQVDPTRCLVVEDATGGLESGRAAGCRTLAVLTHLDPATTLADGMVDTLAAVDWQVDATGVRITLRS